MYYETLFRRLNEYRVKYVVCGGLAVILHGVPRTTADVDVLIDESAANRIRLWDALTSLGYKPVRPVTRERFISKGAVSWLKGEKHAVVFGFVMPAYSFMAVDVVLESPISFTQAVKRSYRPRAGNLTIPVVSIEDLIRMKTGAGRAQDRLDVISLTKVVKHVGPKTKKSKRS